MPSTPPPPLPARRRALRITAFAGPLALVGAMIGTGPALADTTAPETDVATGQQLSDLLDQGGALNLKLTGDTYYGLTGTQVIPSGSDITLDLNEQAVGATQFVLQSGATLTVTSPTSAGILNVDNSAGGGGGIEMFGGSTLNLNAAAVTGTGGVDGAGIGTIHDSTTAATVNISGGAQVVGYGGRDAAGIGGGPNAVPAAVTLQDNSVLHGWGGQNGAGIGGGKNNLPGGSFTTLPGDSDVQGDAGVNAASIGGGAGGPGIDISVSGLGSTQAIGDGAKDSALGAGPGYTSTDGSSGFGSLTIAEDTRFWIPVQSSVTLPADATIDNSGNLELDGELTGSGTVHNLGSILNTAATDAASTVGRIGPDIDVTGNNYVLNLDPAAGTLDPTDAKLQVLSSSVDRVHLTLPMPSPAKGYTFAGWQTPQGGAVADSHALADVAAAEGADTSSTPVAISLIAAYEAVVVTDPTPTPTPTGSATPTPTPTQSSTPAPTDSSTLTPVPTPTQSATPTPSPTQSTPPVTSAPVEKIVVKASKVAVTGRKLTVSASGLSKGEHWTITVDGKKVASGTTSKSTVSAKVALPKAKKHDTVHAVRIVGAHASASLKVVVVVSSKHLALKKTGAKSFTVKGLAPGEHVTVKVAGRTIASGTANAKGVFAFTAKSLKHGKRTLVVKGATGTRSATAKFHIA